MAFFPMPSRNQLFMPMCGCWFIQSSMPTTKQYFPRVAVESTTTILSSTSRTKLTQTFVNSHHAAIPEAQYTFPLYDGVSVVAFTCRIGDRVITGVVKERNQAKTDYDEAIKRGETAGLLEQMPEAADVFTTKLGNIPGGETIVVEIVYLGELRHDAEKDGVRFTIPTAVAPRYGILSSASSQVFSSINTRTQGGMKITVEVAVESGAIIRGLSSPSHPVAITMGRNSHQDENLFQNNLASATLALSDTTTLDQDFVIIVNAQGQDIPRALLETHPEHGRAIMTTLVPKFNLPNIHPEIVFVVDRSGSMDGKIAMVVQALKIFLRSLPTSAKFNICSFGSRHSFLFSKSKPYDETSLKEALQHLESFQANYGGTELQKPIEETVKQRYTGVPLEIMVLTDGQIWRQQALFTFLQSAAKDKVRVFSLGIGSGASTSLVEGMARAGNGFAQFVRDGEQIDKRVVRMLKAALTPHITDYTLEVKYENDRSYTEEDFEIIESFTESMKHVVSSIDKAAVKPLSLFDTNFQEQPTNPSTGRYDHLPPVAVPKILQAPRQVPSLYAFNRTTVYLLLGPDASGRLIKSVVLRGTSEQGPLELEIPVQSVGDGETLHQLAAKKATQELEEGQGWIMEAKSANGELLKTQYEADWERIVEREIVRLGTQFQIAGKYCSFVAVEANDKYGKDSEKLLFVDTKDPSNNGASGRFEKKRAAPKKKSMAMPTAPSPPPPPPAADTFTSPGFGQAYSAPSPFGLPQTLGSGTFGASSQMAQPALFNNSASLTSGSSRTVGGGGGGGGLFGFSNRQAAMHTPPSGGGLFGSAPTPTSSSSLFGASKIATIPNTQSTSKPLFGAQPTTSFSFGQSQRDGPLPNSYGPFGVQPKVNYCVQAAPTSPSGFLNTEGGGAAAAAIATGVGGFGFQTRNRTNNPLTPAQTMHLVINMQQFAGFWQKSDLLLQYLGISEKAFDASLPGGYHDDDSVKATAVVLAWLEVKLADEKEVWEMVADKARTWLVSQHGVEDVETLVDLARDIFP